MKRRVVQVGSVSLFAVAGALVSLALVALAGCKKDPAAVEAEKVAADKAQLGDAVLRDVELDAVMHKADSEAEAGNDDAAAKILESEAIPAADRAVAAATAVHPASAWGTAKAAELLSFVQERRASIVPYAAALKGDDLDAKLKTAEEQLALEQKAMLVLGHLTGELEGATLPTFAPDAGKLAVPPSKSAPAHS